MLRLNAQVTSTLVQWWVLRLEGGLSGSRSFVPWVSMCQPAGLSRYSSSSTWAEAEGKLKQLFPDPVQRGRVRAKLLPLAPAARLEYFDDTDDSVKAMLLSLEGQGAKLPNEP